LKNRKESMEFQKQDYDKYYRKMNQKVAIAIFCILFGITILMVGAEYLTENKMFFPVGICVVLLLVAFGLILKVGFANRTYRKKVIQMPDCYTEEEKKEARKKWKQAWITTLIVLILGMLITGLAYAISFAEKISLLPIAIYFFLLTLLLPQMAYWRLELEKLDANQYNKQEEKEDKKKVIRCSIGMAVTIVLTIGASLIWKNWDISFLVFLFGSVVSIAITTIKKKA